MNYIWDDLVSVCTLPPPPAHSAQQRERCPGRVVAVPYAKRTMQRFVMGETQGDAVCELAMWESSVWEGASTGTLA